MSLDTDPSATPLRPSRASQLLGRRGLLAPAPHKGPSHIRTNEGPRGYSTRVAVYLRHAAYFLTLVLCSSLTHYAMQAAGPYSIDGGKVMFFMAALTLAVGALGTIFYANNRNEIIEQARHYVFGLMVLPATGVSLILWVVKGMITAQANPDAFSQTVDVGLLMVFGAALIMPPVIFMKMMAGIRTLHRSTTDDQEMMQLWSRQDGRQG